MTNLLPTQRCCNKQPGQRKSQLARMSLPQNRPSLFGSGFSGQTPLRAGDACTTGDLGGGKTQLTKRVAAGMGVTDDVTSPTFTIETVYVVLPCRLYHFDLYRLNDPDQLEDTGLYDVLESDGPNRSLSGEQLQSKLARTLDVRF